MARIELPDAARAILLRKLARHLSAEHDLELGGLEAGLLLDWLAEEMGPYWYNQGLQDAQALFQKKWEQIGEAVYELEKPVKG